MCNNDNSGRTMNPLVTVSTAILLLATAPILRAGNADWPQFRGPNAGGVSDERRLPAEIKLGKNVVWKTAVPPGHSSPCICGDRVFLTAFSDSKQLLVLCVDATDGRIRWQKEVPAERIEKVHPRDGSPAQSTPATDGERVYVFFGSVGLVCFDLQGELVWRHELGPFTYHLGWGAASSPIVYDDSVILNCDHDGESFLLALDKTTGRVKWRTSRPHAPPSYSTPILWRDADQTQIIIAGTKRVAAYGAAIGDEKWSVSLPDAFVATTPVAGRELLFVAAVDNSGLSGDFTQLVKKNRTPSFDGMFANHDGNRDGRLSPKEVPRFDKKVFDRIDKDGDGALSRQELQAEFYRQKKSGAAVSSTGARSGNVLAAVRPGGRGDVTDSHVAWRVPQAAPYVSSPIVYGEYVYVVKGGGIVSCFEAATGKQIWRQRIAGSGNYSASPIAGDGRLYFASDRGEVTVLAAGRQPKVLGRTSLGERCLATPAIAGGKLYVRTEGNLYCFGDEEPGLDASQAHLSSPSFVQSKIFTTRGGAHSTTRGTIRLVFPHRGKWLVFHGGPNMYHFSSHGLRWKGAEISRFGARNHLIRDDTIYSFAHIDTDPDPDQQKMVAAAFQGTIRGETIQWGEANLAPHLTLGYYEDLQQDSTGRFTVSGRVPHFDDAGKVTGITIEWARSLRPGDIAAWGPQQQIIHHTSDMKSSEIHENIPLEDGKSYVIGMLSVNGQGRLYGNLFDAEKWGVEDTLLAENMSTVRGTDKRMSAVWDAQAKVIHLSYVDHDSGLWYRTCKSPYRGEDWSRPTKLNSFKVFTNVMSLDTTKTPAHLWLLYGKTVFEHRDRRWQSGELYVMNFDGRSWSESVLVSEPGTKYNWYPNMNEDVSKGIGVMYLKGVPKNQAAIKHTDFDIMFSSTGRPR